MTTYTEQAFQGVTNAFESVQMEFTLFIFAILFHTLVFGKYRIGSGATKTMQLKGAPGPHTTKKEASAGGTQGLSCAKAEAVTAILLLRSNRQGEPSQVDDEILEIYEKQLADTDLSVNAKALRTVVDAALRRGRLDAIERLATVTLDISRWVVLIKNLGVEKRLQDALCVFGAVPVKAVCLYNSLLEACIDCQDMERAEKIMTDAVGSGMADVVTYNTIIKAHLKRADLSSARRAVETMRSAGLQPNIVTFNEMIESATKTNPEGAWRVIEEMQACGLSPNRITCSILLKSIRPGAKSDIERAMAVVSAMEEDMDEVLLSSVVEACIRVTRADLLMPLLKRVRAAKRVQVKGAHTYGSIIRAYGFVEDLEGIWETWRDMRMRHIVPTSITLGCMVEALVTNGDVEAGYELITDMLADEQCRPMVNAVIYCSVLKGFSHQKRVERVWSVYEEMLKAQVKFSIVTFNTLVDACARNRSMSRVPNLLDEMGRQGIEPNLITYSAVIKGYCQENRLDKALDLLDTMRKTARLQPDEITYNTLLDGCARQCLCDRGLTLFEEMQDAGIRPSNFTLSVLVKLASRGKRLDKAFDLCNEVCKKYKFRLNVHVYANLVQACAVQRDIPRAFEVLERMASERVRPDVRTYSLILRPCLVAGQMEDAVDLLRSAAGLQGGHWSLAGFGPTAAKPQGGLPDSLISEVLEGMTRRSHGKSLAIQFLKEMKLVSGFKIDRELQLKLTTACSTDE